MNIQVNKTFDSIRNFPNVDKSDILLSDQGPNNIFCPVCNKLIEVPFFYPSLNWRYCWPSYGTNPPKETGCFKLVVEAVARNNLPLLRNIFGEGFDGQI